MIKVIKFGASWCAPCKAFTPIFEEVAKTFEGQAIFEERDVEESEEYAIEYEIRSVPTIIFLNEEGKVIARLIGTVSKDTIVDTIKKWQQESIK